MENLLNVVVNAAAAAAIVAVNAVVVVLYVCVSVGVECVLGEPIEVDFMNWSQQI